jgi:type I restriction-modification system DNA methylase subunit
MSDDLRKEFLKMLGTVACKSGCDSYDVFVDFLEVGALAIQQPFTFNSEVFASREAEVVKILKKYHDGDATATMKAFGQMLGCVTMALEERVADFLGQTYMMAEFGNNDRGQFFTPDCIAQVMAKMTLHDGMDAIIKDRGYITISDPACGGGVTLIASVAHMKELGYNINKQVCIYAQDIDGKCANMTFIQLALLGVPAVVATGNTLTMEIRRQAFTPMWSMYGFSTKEDRRMREAADPKPEPSPAFTVIDCDAKPTEKAVKECYTSIQQLELF